MADLVYLVRHAAPPPALRGRYWGRADPGIDPGSLAKVGELRGLAWQAPDFLITSPIDRAIRTAEAVGELFSLPVHPDDSLSEINFGRFDGLTFQEIGARYPEQARAWAAAGDRYVFPGGEAIHDFFHRVTGSWRWCLSLPHSTVMVVTHAGVISSWMCLFLGLPLAKRFIFSPAYSSLTAFMRKKDGSGWNLVYFNNGTS